MKANLRTALVFSALAVGLGLTSCVDPYGTATVTTYSTGHRIHTLPGGYRTEILSGNTYYYHNGHYYTRRSGGYVVVDPPRSSRYYSDYNRYRSQHRDNDRYDRSDRNRRDDRSHNHDRDDHRRSQTRIITRLPDGSRPVSVRGQTYYQHRDQYYRRQGSGYIGVSTPF